MTTKARPLNDRERATLFARLCEVSPLAPKEFDRLIRLTRLETIEKGGMFTQIGDKDLKVGFILQGLFRIYYLSNEGKMIIRTLAREGEPLGAYSAAIEGQPAYTNVEALEGSVVVALSYSDFSGLFGLHPEWERFGRKIVEQQYVARERREYQLLALTVEQRYEAFLKDFPGVEKRITQANIASYLGVTPVSLSRVLGRQNKKT